MPRGGGRKVTHARTDLFSDIYAFSSLTRLLFVAAVFLCRNEKKSNPSFFFSCFRARVYRRRRSLLSQRRWSLSLSACAAECSIGRSGFPKRALRKRERERDKRMWFPISPTKTREKESEDQRFDFTRRKEVQKRGKKNESTEAKTYRRKKEKELKRKRERERKRVFF